MHSSRLAALFLAVVVVLPGCDEEQPADGTGDVVDVESDRGRRDTTGETDANGEDPGLDGVDLPPGGSDLDQDGLPNVCEQAVEGLDPANEDSDGDGILDGVEDANQNCVVDPGETDPTRIDTDSDGITDPAESGYGTDPTDSDTDDDGINDGNEVAFTETDPLEPDSDGDGCLDGVEDRDGDGVIGSCPPEDYAVSCAEGETDPNVADTDGDGVNDCEEVGFVACAPEGLRDPQLVRTTTADVTLAVETEVVAGVLGFPTLGTPRPAGAWLDDQAHNIAAFVLTLEPDSPMTDLDELAALALAGSVTVVPEAQRRTTGRPIRSHDNFDALVKLLIELPTAATPDAVRLELVAALAGVDAGDVTLDSAGGFSSSEGGLIAAFEVLSRNPGTAVLVGAVTTREAYDDEAGSTGIRVDDLTGGSALAAFDAGLEPACVSYLVTGRPEVDFIWSIDGSGSMSTEREDVAGFAESFGSLLSSLDIDFRLGVIGGECSFLGQERDVSSEARALLAGADDDCVGSPPFGIPFPNLLPGANGELCNDRFTTSTSEFASCVRRMSEIHGEYTLSMGAVAIDRALPRSRDSVSRIRPDAEVVLVVVTDEHEQSFEDALDWMALVENGPADATQQAELDALVSRYLEFFGRPDTEATVFGIYWVPNEACDTGAEVAFGIHQAVVGTGGTAGSVCLSDITATLEEIAAASSGLASTFRLSGRPVALTIKVARARPGESAAEVPRSRQNGFDFDSAVNRVLFVGDATPDAGDEVTISYQRWVGGSIGCESDEDCPIKYFCRDGECI